MNNKELNLSGVTAQTWARTIWLIIALVGEWVVVLGLQPLPESITSLTIEQITTYLTIGFQTVQNIVNWWKNNSMTVSGQAGDVTMKAIENNGYTFPKSGAEHHREVG